MSQPVAGLYVELRALVSKFQQDMDGAVKTVLGAEKRLTGTFNTINKVAQAALVVGGVVAVKKLSDAFVELADKGDKAGDIAENFKRLGGSSQQIEQARKNILGVVDSFELMRIANQGLLKQIPGVNENFGLLAEYGNKLADTLGMDAKAGIEEVVGALGTAKEKQLAAIGVTIDAEKAYKSYADQIGATAKQLSDAQKKEARQIASLEEIAKKNKQLAPITESVTQANERLNASINEGLTNFGMAINDSEELTEAYNGLADVIDDIDWKTLGENVAEMFALMANGAQKVIPWIEKFFNDFSTGMNYILGEGLEAKTLEAKSQLEQAQKTLASIESSKPLGYGMIDSVKNAHDQKWGKAVEDVARAEQNWSKVKAELTGEQEKQKKGAFETAKAIGDLAEAGAKNNKVVVPSIKHTGLSADALSDQAKEAKKAAEEMEKLREKWSDYLRETSEDNLKDSLKDAIDAGDIEQFDKLKEQYKKVVKEGFVDEWQDAIKSGAVSLEEVEKEAEKLAEHAGQEMEDELVKAGVESARKTAEEYSRAFDDVGSELAGLGDALGVNLDGIISTASKFLSDESKAGIMDGIGSAFGEFFGGGKFTGSEVSGVFSAAQTGLSAVFGAKDKDSANKDNSGTGGAIGAGAGIAIGAVVGGPIGAAIGAQIGQVAGEMIGGLFKWGSQNPETLARHAFANFIEESFEKLGQVSFFDAQGKMQNVMGKNFNFVEGSKGRFNDPDWVKGMDSWGDKAKGTFLGLGEAMKEMQGITEDVGSQIGFLLGENLAGNIDNARLLVQQLGFTFEEMEEALFQSARKGNMRWSEFTAHVAGLQEAFQPGLSAVNDMSGAMEGLIGSGGRGVAALKGVRDAAVEAMEGGANSIEQMGQQMMAQGVDPTLVQDFMESVRASGVKTLEELANASDRTAASVVANLEGNNEGVRQQWEQMTQDLKEMAEIIEKIPSEKDVQLNVRTTFDENTRQLMEQQGVTPATSTENVTAYADGGIVDRPTFFGHGNGKLGVAGEAGAEAILPLARVGGKLGVMAVGGGQKGGSTYIIDARGATPGMENRIKSALREVEERAVRRSLNAVAENSRRGGRF